MLWALHSQKIHVSPQSYGEAIRVAEEREKTVRTCFDRYDTDDSGTIDMQELMALLDDLGILTKLKTERINFTTEMFIKYDANDDGVLRWDLTHTLDRAKMSKYLAMAISRCDDRPGMGFHSGWPSHLQRGKESTVIAALPVTLYSAHTPSLRSRSFEEFKGLYNAAIDDAAGARRPAKANANARQAAPPHKGPLLMLPPSTTTTPKPHLAHDAPPSRSTIPPLN